MKKHIKTIFVIASLVICTTLTVQAQPGDGTGFGDDPNDVPVDGGVIVLAIAGLGYASRKWLKQ